MDGTLPCVRPGVEDPIAKHASDFVHGLLATSLKNKIKFLTTPSGTITFYNFIALSPPFLLSFVPLIPFLHSPHTLPSFSCHPPRRNEHPPTSMVSPPCELHKEILQHLLQQYLTTESASNKVWNQIFESQPRNNICFFPAASSTTASTSSNSDARRPCRNNYHEWVRSSFPRPRIVEPESTPQ